MLFDSHSHISDPRFDADRQGLYRQIREAGLSVVMDVGADLASSVAAVRTARENDFCYAVVGCHPHESKDFDEEQLTLIKGLAQKPKVQAIGEIGLDYHYDFSDRETQRFWFARQVQLAVALRMPMVIHDREAHEDVMGILKENGAFSPERRSAFPLRPDGTPDARVLLHCYSGGVPMAEQYVKLGATLSIAGPITYRNARRAREVVEALDLTHLLVETDAPYLAPEPCRGRTNIPPYVEHTVRKVAEIKGLTYEETARQTCRNGCRFFGIQL